NASPDTGLPLREADGGRASRLSAGMIAAHSLAIGLYGANKWWNQGFSGGFRTENEGWFGNNTYAGGADKLGHLYSTYVSTRLFTRAFHWAGNSPEKSLALAAWTTAGTYVAVEVLDGLSKQWRFSREDVVMNLAGVGAALLLEKNPDLDRLLDLRLLYWPSRQNGRQFEPFGDYAGQTYLLVAKASGMPRLRSHPLLRYVEFAVGYNARGFPESPGRLPAGDASRSLYVGLSLNLSELLERNAARQGAPPGRAMQAVGTFLEFIQVPGTAVFTKHPF
ncbi:MAG: DUF2279 domain-containing protein, partial [Noviherbaspirillum sp.]